MSNEFFITSDGTDYCRTAEAFFHYIFVPFFCPMVDIVCTVKAPLRSMFTHWSARFVPRHFATRSMTSRGRTNRGPWNGAIGRLLSLSLSRALARSLQLRVPNDRQLTFELRRARPARRTRRQVRSSLSRSRRNVRRHVPTALLNARQLTEDGQHEAVVEEIRRRPVEQHVHSRNRVDDYSRIDRRQVSSFFTPFTSKL